jgi:hypothetical protein
VSTPGVAAASAPPREPTALGGLLTFKRLEILSFCHSAVYLALLTVWLVPGLHGAEMVLGWCHGIGWIVMSILCLIAQRSGVVTLRLAVLVALVGGIGPFAGTIGFVYESRHRANRPSAAQNAR